ncbi:MAG: Short-chain dehydrogenase [Acidimicrobiia bacterium]|nr:Short-chain dehydrogenase [Acidimicrobiia bacterium]
MALITGSGGGIGRAHALAMAAQGARVVVNDPGVSLDGSGSSHDPADAVVAEIRSAGGEAVADYGSVASYDGAAEIVGRAVTAFGGLDIVVNNASVFHGLLFDDMSEQQWDEQLGVHVKGAFNICKHALPVMVKQSYGRVINTSSASAFGGVGFAAYSTAKSALLGFTYALAAEYWRHGITVNAITPNAGTAHRMIEGAQWMERVASRGFQPPGAGEEAPPPEFVPPLVIYLASAAGASISGKVFDVGGTNVGVFPHAAVADVVSKPRSDGPWTQEELAAVIPGLLASTGDRAPGVGA